MSFELIVFSAFFPICPHAEWCVWLCCPVHLKVRLLLNDQKYNWDTKLYFIIIYTFGLIIKYNKVTIWSEQLLNIDDHFFSSPSVLLSCSSAGKYLSTYLSATFKAPSKVSAAKTVYLLAKTLFPICFTEFALLSTGVTILVFTVFLAYCLVFQ